MGKTKGEIQINIAANTDTNPINRTGKTRTQIIKNLLQQKKKEISKNKSRLKETKKAIKKRKPECKSKIKENTKIKIVHKDKSKIEPDDLPLAVRLLKPEGSNIPSVQLPEISSQNWNNFKREVKKKETNQKVKKCSDRMHNYHTFDLHFSSLRFIRKAIVDSLLSRKWDNLVRLLVMLIKNYNEPVFTMFIRHMCEILKHYHPRIRGTYLEDQIQLIMEKYEKLRNSKCNVVSMV